MLERLISSCLRQRTMIIVMVILVIGLGLYSFWTMHLDAFPDLTNVQVEIVCTSPGLSALEIERYVTHPVEMSMRGIPGLVQMRSVTKFGISVVTLVFRDDVDIYRSRQLVFERLSETGKQIPPNVEVEMGPIATAMGEIYQYTLSGEMPRDSTERIASLTSLRTLQDWTLAPILKGIPGVNEVNSFGGYLKQYHVIAFPERLLKYGVTLDDVYSAIERSNENVGGNVIDRYSEQLIVRGIGTIRSPDEIGKIVLKSIDGVPVLIENVAAIRIGEAVRQGAALVNGGDETVGGVVMMLRGENSRDVVAAVRKKVDELNESGVLPRNIRITPFYDRSEIVELSLETVARALVEGALLVIIVLYLLLRNIRSALVVLLALPLALLVTFIVMKSVGLSANLMSLGGLAISIGLIIDATIIQVENVQRRLSEEGPSGSKISNVLRAVLEVRKPSMYGELIIAITFIPILTLQGLEGKMFAPLALTVAIALVSSLLLSIFVIPVLCGILLSRRVEAENPIVRGIRNIYHPLLMYSLKKRKRVVIGTLIAFVVALFGLSRLGTEFMPVMDEGAFDMDVQMLPGVSLDASLEMNRHIMQTFSEIPELKTIVARTGQSGIALEARSVDKTAYTGIFKARDTWREAVDMRQLTDQLRRSLAGTPGVAYSFSQPIQCRIDELVAGTKAELIVRVFGENLDSLVSRADRIARILGQVRGATDVIVERIKGQSYLEISIDRAKVARHGLNTGDVLRTVEIAIGGKTASRIYEENRFFDLVLRYPPEVRNNIESIGNTMIPAPAGYHIPLRELARITITPGPVQVSREDGMRCIGIELNVQDRDIGSFVNEAGERIRAEVPMPPGSFVTWGGQFENQQRAMYRFMLITPIVIGLIIALLYMTFRSFRVASVVLLNLPFALIGGVMALWITGMYLSVPAAVGFIILFGVAVLNGIVLVSSIVQLRQDGVGLREAIERACINRLRPVLMTALIAIFSLLPLLFATGPGSEIQKPLAVVVVGGLFSSTILTLIIIPVVFGWIERK